MVLWLCFQKALFFRQVYFEIFTGESVLWLGFASKFSEETSRWGRNWTGLAMSWLLGLRDGQKRFVGGVWVFLCVFRIHNMKLLHTHIHKCTEQNQVGDDRLID